MDFSSSNFVRHQWNSYYLTLNLFTLANLKRYGLEGGESMLPALDSLFSVASKGKVTVSFPHNFNLNQRS